MRIHLRRSRRWLVLGLVLLVVVACAAVALSSRQPLTGEATFLVLDVEYGAPMPGVTVYFYPEPKSLRGWIARWLNVQKQVTGPDGKVRFAAPADAAFSARVADSPTYNNVPPLPGYRPPAGLNGVFFLARKTN
jgi:hypothetical protein